VNQSKLQRLLSKLHQRLSQRQNFQKILKNLGWLFVDRLLRVGVGLVVGSWVANYLGPKQFGLFNYAIAFVSLFGSLSSLGLDSIVVRDIVRQPERRAEILGSALSLRVLGGCLTLLITVNTIGWLRPGETVLHWLVGLSAAGMIFQAFDTIDLWFQSQVQSRFTIYAKNVAFLAVSGIRIALIQAQAPLIAFAWASLAEVIISGIGLVYTYQFSRNQSNPQSIRHWRINFAYMKQVLSDSWAISLSGIAIVVQARIDQVMLGQMIGDDAVGQYSAAMRLIEFFGFIPMIVQSSVAPSITAAKAQGEQIYHDKLLNIYRLMFILFILVSVPVALLANKMVALLYGDDYKQAGILLSLFAIRLLFTNFSVARGLYIANESLFRYSLITAISGSLINIGLNAILIPDFAAAGSIWATIISFMFTTFIIDYFFVSTRQNLMLMLKAIVTPWGLLKSFL
jgi:O-antigen/teichoic acid export membrane protein